jgi:cell division protease FtsH
MTRITPGRPAFTPLLNDFFPDALARLNTLWELPGFDPDKTVNQGPGSVWREITANYDIATVTALIQLCSALPQSGDALVSAIYDPFTITVVTTQDTRWIEPTVEVLKLGLFPAMEHKHDYLPKMKIYHQQKPDARSNPAKQKEDFKKELSKALRNQPPAVIVVATQDQLPVEIRKSVSNVFVLVPLCRKVLLKLHAVIHDSDSTGQFARAFQELPLDSALQRLNLQDVSIAARHREPVEMARALSQFVEQNNTSENPDALNQMKGLGPSRAPLKQLAQDMRAWTANELEWSEIPSGVLLYGPPGTGKTFTASKLAEAVGGHFIATSYADWQREGHLGDFLAAMYRCFQEARDNAPSVLFIDEIDSFTDRAKASGDNATYIRSTVNAILEQLDGTAKSEGVLVVGACNDISSLDPALSRSGRFDQKVSLHLPDKQAIAEILKSHVPDSVSVADIERTAAHLVGQSGADAAAVVRQAQSLSRYHRRSLTGEDLWTAAQKTTPTAPVEDLKRAAIHEAGHAIVGFLLGKGLPLNAEIGSTGGFVQFRQLSAFPTQNQLQGDLVTLLAGRAAESLYCEAPSAAAGGGMTSDLARATLLAVRLEFELGLGSESLIWRHVTESSLPDLLKDVETRSRINNCLKDAEQTATRILKEHGLLVKSIALDLLSKRQLTAVELASLLQTPSGPASKHPKAADAPSSKVPVASQLQPG